MGKQLIQHNIRLEGTVETVSDYGNRISVTITVPKEINDEWTHLSLDIIELIQKR